MVDDDNERDFRTKINDFYETHQVAIWGNILFIIGWFINEAIYGSRLSLILPFGIFAIYKVLSGDWE